MGCDGLLGKLFASTSFRAWHLHLKGARDDVGSHHVASVYDRGLDLMGLVEVRKGGREYAPVELTQWNHGSNEDIHEYLGFHVRVHCTTCRIPEKPLANVKQVRKLLKQCCMSDGLFARFGILKGSDRVKQLQFVSETIQPVARDGARRGLGLSVLFVKKHGVIRGGCEQRPRDEDTAHGW